MRTEPWWTCNVCGAPIARTKSKNRTDIWAEHRKACTPISGGSIVQWDQRELRKWKDRR